MPKITLGITELHEVLSWDYGIEEPFLEPSENALKIGSTLRPVPRQKQKNLPLGVAKRIMRKPSIPHLMQWQIHSIVICLSVVSGL